MKLDVSKVNRSPSPTKRGKSMGRGSDQKSGKKSIIPTTPRSMDKQRKIIANVLRIEMDTNTRYKAHNRSLKEANRELLDMFAMKD